MQVADSGKTDGSIDSTENQPADNKGLLPIHDSTHTTDTLSGILHDTTTPDTLLRRVYDSPDTMSTDNGKLVHIQVRENDSLGDKLSLVNKNTADLPAYITQAGRYYRDRWGLGYEEGPSLRFRFNSRTESQKRTAGLTFGIGYQNNQLKDQYHQALHEYHVRIGLYQECAVFSRVRIAAYFDAMEKMKHQEAEPLLFETRFNRYALWITKIRAGVQINLFSLEHFLLTYRFGFEFAYCTPPYIVNESKTTFLQYGKGIFSYGISGSDLSALEMIVNNIGIYIYF